MRHEELIGQPCSIIRPLSVLGDRWTFMLVKEAFDGVRRFDEFQQRLGIARSRLADRLERLVDEAVLRKEPYKEGGRTRQQYRLTEKGHDLYPVLLALREFGDKHMAPDGPPVHYRHVECGGEAHVHVVCDRCGAPLAARDIVPVDGPGRCEDRG